LRVRLRLLGTPRHRTSVGCKPRRGGGCRETRPANRLNVAGSPRRRAGAAEHRPRSPRKTRRVESPQLPRAHEVRPRASGVGRKPVPVRPKDDVKAMHHGRTTTAHAMAIRGHARARLPRRERRAGSSAARARRRSSLNDRPLKSTPSSANSSGSRLSDLTRRGALRPRATCKYRPRMTTPCHRLFGKKRPDASPSRAPCPATGIAQKSRSPIAGTLTSNPASSISLPWPSMP